MKNGKDVKSCLHVSLHHELSLPCVSQTHKFLLFLFLFTISIKHEKWMSNKVTVTSFTPNLVTAEYESSKKWLINSAMHQPHTVTPIQRHLYQVAFSWLDYYHFILAEIYVQSGKTLILLFFWRSKFHK